MGLQPLSRRYKFPDNPACGMYHKMAGHTSAVKTTSFRGCHGGTVVAVARDSEGNEPLYRAYGA
jgi:hypothetical protein